MSDTWNVIEWKYDKRKKSYKMTVHEGHTHGSALRRVAHLNKRGALIVAMVKEK